MRADQYERLHDLSEQVGEVFIEEADSNGWSGAGLPLSSLDEKTRGNRYWDKKNAIQTGTLLARILDLAERDKNRGGSGLLPPDDADKEIQRYEKQAKELISAIQSGKR